MSVLAPWTTLLIQLHARRLSSRVFFWVDWKLSPKNWISSFDQQHLYIHERGCTGLWQWRCSQIRPTIYNAQCKDHAICSSMSGSNKWFSRWNSRTQEPARLRILRCQLDLHVLPPTCCEDPVQTSFILQRRRQGHIHWGTYWWSSLLYSFSYFLIWLGPFVSINSPFCL